MKISLVAKGALKLATMPSRAAFELFLHFGLRGKPPVALYYSWGCLFLFLSAIALFTFNLPGGIRSWPEGWRIFALWLLPYSRIIEIAFAFYSDARDRLARKPKRTPRLARLNLLALSYIEVAVEFAVLYIAFSPSSFKGAIKTPMDSLFFSWTTITTTGYGDITPVLSLSRMVAMCEVGIGLLLLVFSVGSYLSSEVQEGSHEQETPGSKSADPDLIKAKN